MKGDHTAQIERRLRGFWRQRDERRALDDLSVHALTEEV
jgi:uncharacterized protein YjiS (DUF1127 family)